MQYPTSTKKIILVLLDGLGDRAYPELDHRTPLQAARTPHLDRMAALGCSGLYHPGFPGQCLPSEVAHYRMFGYEMSAFPGRGLLEAAGETEKVPFADKDVLCLAHLVRVERKASRWILTEGRDTIAGSASELARLYAAIDRFERNGILARLHQIGRNDAILVLQGPVSAYISDSDPIRTGLPIARIVPLAGNPQPREAERTARFLNHYLLYCHRNLDLRGQTSLNCRTTANFLVTQRCGRRKLAVSFEQKWGLRGMLLASGRVYIGLARELGLETRRFADGNDPGKDLGERIDAALADKSHDFFHVHTKAPDHAAHQGSPQHKRDVISALDRGMASLVDALQSRDDLIAAVCADHSTPCSSVLVHSGEPVPVVIAGSGVRRDGIQKFSEIDAPGGALGQLRGSEVLHMLLNYADRSTLHTHRLGAEAVDYFPPRYPRLRDEPDF